MHSGLGALTFTRSTVIGDVEAGVLSALNMIYMAMCVYIYIYYICNIICVTRVLCSVMPDSDSCERMDCSPPDPLSMGFSRQEYWSGWPFPTPGDLPHPGIEPKSLAPLALAGRFFTNSATREASIHIMATVKILTGLCPCSPLNPWTS